MSAFITLVKNISLKSATTQLECNLLLPPVLKLPISVPFQGKPAGPLQMHLSMKTQWKLLESKPKMALYLHKCLSAIELLMLEKACRRLVFTKK